MSEYKMPERIKALPVDPVRKIPVPWFVAWVDGKPEFRAADHQKFVRALNERRCWVCGEKLGRTFTFVAGPMCGLNRTSAEPPSHTECALYSVHACPFLSRPHMERREGGFDKMEAIVPAGEMILRNPGVTLLWTTKKWTIFDDGRGGKLLRLGDPINMEWFAEGRAATRAEVAESVRTGLPALEAMAAKQDEIDFRAGRTRQGLSAIEKLHSMAVKYQELYPKV